MTGFTTRLLATAVLILAAAAVAAGQEAPAAATPANPYVPPACSGIFTDVACPGGFAVNWIEKFYGDGITAGCNAAPLQYCPDSTVTRAQMAVFVEKAMRGTAAWSPGDLGSENTGIGNGALLSNSGFAEWNTALGYQALWVQSYANGNAPYAASNTAVGAWALLSNQPDGGNFNFNGTGNSALGAFSLQGNTTGYFNTAVGHQALMNNHQGFDNVAVGPGSGNGITTGSADTFVGYGADAAAASLTNATAIGALATVDASDHVRIGNDQVTQIGGQVGWSNLSDARHKQDIHDLDLGLDFVLALRPVAFTMKSGNGRTDMGFVAQDVEALVGDEYNVLGIGGDQERTLSLRYTDLIAPLVKAVQEQQAQLDAKNTRIAELEARAVQAQARVDAQQAQIESRDARMGALEARLAAIEARLAGR